jgi:hypothetical protein
MSTITKSSHGTILIEFAQECDQKTWDTAMEQANSLKKAQLQAVEKYNNDYKVLVDAGKNDEAKTLKRQRPIKAFKVKMLKGSPAFNFAVKAGYTQEMESGDNWYVHVRPEDGIPRQKFAMTSIMGIVWRQSGDHKEYLLVRQRHGKRFLKAYTGFGEPSECIVKTMIREANEELNIQIPPNSQYDMIAGYVLQKAVKQSVKVKDSEQIAECLYVFAIKIDDNASFNIQINEELKNCKWVHEKDIKGNPRIERRTGRFIQSHLNGAALSVNKTTTSNGRDIIYIGN